jgi:phage FluMu gp28-like protein
MLPERVFLQEYEAEFIDDAGGVFRRIMEMAVAVEQDKARPGHEYAIGVDWARFNDATVFMVLDCTLKHICYIDRMVNIDYGIQRRRLVALNERFRPTEIIAEYNSMGGPQVEALQDDGLPVRGFTTTNQTKKDAIDALAHAFETGDIGIIPDPVLIGELQAFEQDRTPAGNYKFGAPEGMHDDCVIATALAWQAVAANHWLMT